jgi:hypothetical protein
MRQWLAALTVRLAIVAATLTIALVLLLLSLLSPRNSASRKRR